MPSLTRSSGTEQWRICLSGDDPCGMAEPAVSYVDYILLRDHDEVLEEFVRHTDSLPSIDDFEAQLRRDDPDFEENAARAHEARYRELFSVVEAGSLSRVYVERITRKITQAELANLASTQQPNISRIEKPGRQISANLAKRLADVFDMDYRELLSWQKPAFRC